MSQLVHKASGLLRNLRDRSDSGTGENPPQSEGIVTTTFANVTGTTRRESINDGRYLEDESGNPARAVVIRGPRPVIPGFEDSPERPLRSPFTENSGSFLALRPHHYPKLLEANGSRKRKDLTREQIEHNRSVIALSNEIDAPAPPPKDDKSVHIKFVPSRRHSKLKPARHVFKPDGPYFTSADLALEREEHPASPVPTNGRPVNRWRYREEAQVREAQHQVHYTPSALGGIREVEVEKPPRGRSARIRLGKFDRPTLKGKPLARATEARQERAKEEAKERRMERQAAVPQQSRWHVQNFFG